MTSNVSGLAEPVARYGTPTLIAPRLGQGAFRIAVTEAYGRQCAISEGKVLPALDAAHIRPYSEGGPHTKSNGILLRKDIHCVFDAGYATINSRHRFVVSSKVKKYSTTAKNIAAFTASPCGFRIKFRIIRIQNCFAGTMTIIPRLTLQFIPL